ncbi:SDR family NAD(P)-dependent oxidoreductase [uncultured Pseudokineococcus sp.]|uniref:SDR family NAD(P)-dependent oxidoreductase n=1 Tax=uncultured Pseudokineococcus sp. TaxID=1642928 RepID=UPI002619255F|nr:SDR family NAD(P)-dependent oxidoreductase [uncultured Pseudokineococcus sp.]
MSAPGEGARPPLDGPPGAGAGRTVLVTGASSGIGWHAARRLAALGARVLMASRDADRGRRAADAVRTLVPGADVEVVALDLADLRSVRACAEEVGRRGPLDGLLANAGGLLTGPRRTSPQGSELTLATAHLGHAALTASLLPALEEAGRGTGDARVVAAGSLAHRFVRPPADDRGWQSEDDFTPFRAYCRSKLAVLLHAAELDRRLREAGAPVRSLAFHPGYAIDLLDDEDPQGPTDRWPRAARRSPAARAGALAAGLLLQGKDGGARPAVAALLGPAAVDAAPVGSPLLRPAGFGYVGPGGALELAGAPRRARTTAAAADPDEAARLWALTARLTGSDPGP